MTQSKRQTTKQGTANANTSTGPEKFSELADSMIALMNDENTPAGLEDLLGQTIEEIKNTSGVLEEPDLERAMVARGVHRIYSTDGANAPTTQPTEEAQEEEEEQQQPTIADPRADHIFATSTFKDARRIANGATLQRKEWRDDEIGDLLALMFGLAYCAPGDREGILYEVVNAFMPSIGVARKSTERLTVERFALGRTHWMKEVEAES